MTDLQAYYEAIRTRHDLVHPENVDARALESRLQRRFVAVDDPGILRAALDRPTLVCTGVSTTGPPHLGTVGQLLTAIELQDVGLDVQFVIADLEPYHGGADADRIRRLAARYRAFALDLGFDPGQGALRTQSAATDVMATGHRLARYYRPGSWDDVAESDPQTDWERAVAAHYDCEGDGDGGGAGPTSDAADVHSAVLHGADFLHPLREDDYEQVLLVFGADEYDLLPWTRQFREAADVSGRVGGLFTRMVPGFDGVPKQSKSTGAGVTLDEDPAAIRERVATAPDANGPATSTVFQSACLASRYGADRLDALESACEVGGAEWDEARREYADYVAELAERWLATAG